MRSLTRSRLAGKAALAAALLATGVPLHAADSGTLAVSAVVLSRNSCRFVTTSWAIDFGTIDPSSGANATASVSASFVCRGSSASATYSIVADDGLYSPGAGSRRMRHGTATTQYMAYSLALTPASATVPKNTTQSVTMTGTITPAQFGDAIAGSYSDTVGITLSP
jgi:spore coat protein U-like protein